MARWPGFLGQGLGVVLKRGKKVWGLELVDHEGNTLALLDLAEVASPSGERLEEVSP